MLHLLTTNVCDARGLEIFLKGSLAFFSSFNALNLEAYVKFEGEIHTFAVPIGIY